MNLNGNQLKNHPLNNKCLIIFDWDGTLQDTIGLIVEAMHIAGETNGFSAIDKAIKGING